MKSGRWSAYLVLALALATMASGVLLAYARHEHRAQFRVQQEMIAERDRLEVEWGALQLERATVMGYRRIDQEARNRLAMRRPDPRDIVFLRVASTGSAIGNTAGTGR